MRKKIFDFLKSILSLSVSIIIATVFCTNTEVVLGNLGSLKVQIELADNARLNNEYSESIKWYNKVAKKDSNYAPYAHLAIAEIYSLELENKNYERALEEYKYAVYQSTDIQIFNSAICFVIQQIELTRENPNFAIDFFNEQNIIFVVDIMNRMNAVDPNRFSSLPISFPVNAEDVKTIFSFETQYEVLQYKWEYVSTITSDQSNLSYTNDTEKVMLVDSWEELVDSTCFSTIRIYEYYRYKKVQYDSYKINSLDAVQRVLDTQKPIFLKQLHFD